MYTVETDQAVVEMPSTFDGSAHRVDDGADAARFMNTVERSTAGRQGTSATSRS